MRLALYRKYRPAVFDDVCGQKHITDVLRYEVENDRVSHAYLFCGSRGTGKTTCAKILAKAVNCESPVGGSPCCKCDSCRDIDAGLATDVIEMDAASNNGVDAIRSLIDEVVYTPSMLKKKVYIIDEVHMLSTGAFNALLKTIEEPPEHIVFILATTELNKIPTTIVSRCQRFDFRRINMRVIAERLEYIAKSENILLEKEAALLLARQAEGGMRDAIGLFELCGSGGADVTAARVSEILGLSGYDKTALVMKHIGAGDMGALFAAVAEISASSKDLSVFWQELTAFVRDMLVSKYSDNTAEYLDLTDSEYALLSETTASFSLQQLVYFCRILDEAAQAMARSPQTKRMTAEFALVKMCRPELDASSEALSARIAKLEDKLALMDIGSVNPSPKTENATQVSAPKAESTNIRYSKDIDTVADIPKVPKKEAPAEAVDTGYDRVRDISEAVGKLDDAGRSIASFLMSAEAYVSRDGKRLMLKSDGFGSAMLSSESSKKAIADAFALAKITDGRAEVTVTKNAPKASSGAPSDELGRLL